MASFEVGQKVVYPNHGVSMIEDISAMTFDETEQTFFHLRLLSNNSKVMVPEENLDLVGLRPLCTQKEIRTLLGILENGKIDTYKDWKGRYKQNLDKMKTGLLTEVAEVLKNLCLVSQKKSLSFREKKMYERAKYFIVSEVAHVKDVDEEAADKIVEEQLENSLAKLAAAKQLALEQEEKAGAAEAGDELAADTENELESGKALAGTDNSTEVSKAVAS